MNMYRQIWLLGAIRAIRMFMITMPVIVLYWQSHGLLIRDIFVLQVVFSVAIVLFEIPSGYFADRFGYKTSIVLGTILGTLGFFTYWIWPSYLGFLLAEIVLALSTGFMSGARDALLHNTLAINHMRETYTKWQGRLMAVGTSSEAIAAVSAGVIASLSSIETVLLIQWIIMLLAIPLALALTEVRHTAPTKTPTLLQILNGSIRKNVRLRYLNLFAGALSASTLTMTWFIQPHWKALGIEVLYFGYLWAGLNLVVGLGSLLSHHLERYLRFRTLFGVFAAAPLVLYGLTSYLSTSLVVLCIVPFFWLLRGVAFPVIQDYVQRECADGERATVLSINALVSRFIFSVFSPFLGWVADIWDFQTAFAISGVVFGSLTVTSFVLLYAAMQRKVV